MKESIYEKDEWEKNKNAGKALSAKKEAKKELFMCPGLSNFAEIDTVL